MLSQIKKQTYLGSFTLNNNHFEFDLVKTRQELIALGDIVYFLISGDEILKVGKAGGKVGFACRLDNYKRGEDFDATNRLMTRVIREHNIEKVDIYAIPCPRAKSVFYDPIMEQEDIIETPTNVAIEKKYASLLKETHDLKFCRQIL